MAKITVLGAGGFGISLAVMAENYGHEVTVWSSISEEIEAIRRDGEQKEKLPGIKIPKNIKLSTDISCVAGCDVVLFGIPTAFVREVAKNAAPYITSSMIVLNTGKGFEMDTHKRMSEVLSEEIKNAPIVAMSGPSHAEEVSMGIPTTVAVASLNKKAAHYIQDILCNEVFRIYLNNDIIGCEIGGALKNIIALSSGICDGMGYGDNTKAALMTRGISEIARLGVAMGAKKETFAGLTGIGDLIVTCTSMHSRNRRAGILIGQGVDPIEAIKQVGTVEGYSCCKAAWELRKKLNVEMPITEQLHKILFEDGTVKEALENLMSRPSRHETEGIFLSECKN
ncbi:MAG: NAD(P)H-dependent glycerol-3-phosphate dehydrogenase [Clostridiales bacterium]|nr:NAD(P)H-dependent glycerol-3-phosphate dehydrogenase [Clostridiales bacterium]